MQRVDFDRRLRALIRSLARQQSHQLFNPYQDRDPSMDRADGAAIRRRNLREYLISFRNARYVLVGEAAGYNGCRFSGIPFTGEDLLVGPTPLPWTKGCSLARSSLTHRPLSSERSANIVWQPLKERGDIVLWNTVPWHPHRPGAPLSNRKPNRSEVEQGLSLLERFLEIFPAATPVAVGRVAEEGLARIGIEARYVRHPSMGGKNAFLQGVQKL